MAQYLKQDSEIGYIEDNAEIEYLKFNNMRHTVLGYMLGDFDESGAYVVSPEICKELIEMKKYVFDTYDNIEICRSELKLDKQITFMVTFEGNRATLSLVEKLSYEANYKLNSGTYCNINEYLLDQVETVGEINRNVIYQRWNISPYSGNVVDIFNCDEEVLAKYFGITKRFKYLMKANKVLLDKEQDIEDIETEYAVEIFNILKRYPKLQKEVLEQVKNTLNEKKAFVCLDKPNFAKTINEILDKTIENNIATLSTEEKQQFDTEKRNAQLSAEIKKNDLINTEKVPAEVDSAETLGEVVKLPRVAVDSADAGLVDVAAEMVKSQRQAADFAKKRATLKNDLFDILVAAGVVEESILSAEGLEAMIASRTVVTVVETVTPTQVVGTDKKENKERTATGGGNTAGKSGGKTGGKTGGKNNGTSKGQSRGNAVVKTNQKGREGNAPYDTRYGPTDAYEVGRRLSATGLVVTMTEVQAQEVQTADLTVFIKAKSKDYVTVDPVRRIAEANDNHVNATTRTTRQTDANATREDASMSI